ncbi:MAG: 2-epi-5-epi-valiolone synthase, partial [Rhodanobacter sp.]
IASCFQSDHGGRILDRAISGMLEELQPNLFENELARNVDFGHTFSYGLETHHEERLLHGEAVLLDIAVSVLIARRRGLLDAVEVERVFALIAALGITLDTGVLDTDLMWHSLLDRIEHRNGWQRVPLPDGLGHCVFVNDINPAEITASIESLIARTSRQHDPVLEC